MSTLNVANITDGTTTLATEYVVNGSAKAWANFNGTGTIATRDSLNAASVSDIGIGLYAVNLSSAMSNANYSTQVCSNAAVNNNGYDRTDTGSMTSSFCPARHYESGGTATDTDLITVSIHGDLA